MSFVQDENKNTLNYVKIHSHQNKRMGLNMFLHKQCEKDMKQTMSKILGRIYQRDLHNEMTKEEFLNFVINQVGIDPTIAVNSVGCQISYVTPKKKEQIRI